ncbi:MAG: trypsin-like peptidase domain-containing protein [Myxococcales bacterium]|nr:trypsin-like peptidase domain-containing protein [Myxococcales bacterium]
MGLVADTKDSLRLAVPDVFNIAHALNVVGRNNHSDVADLFPFRNGWRLEVFGDERWYVARMLDAPAAVSNHITQFAPDDISPFLAQLAALPPGDLTELIALRGRDWYGLLGGLWYGQDRFTYIRRRDAPGTNDAGWWDDIATQLAAYLDLLLLPALREVHSWRFAQALPKPVPYDLANVTPSLWVLECEETSTQGTAFALEGSGLVTCEHVVGTATKAFQASAPTKRYPVEVVCRHSVVDLAVLRINTPITQALTRGYPAEARQLDPLAVFGFPNYRLGDSGTVVVGSVAGFRTISGIRRILTNAPIISGNSGGPVLDGVGRVIGVAVTGAERMERAQDTENHGVIPIDALDLISEHAGSP